jgi:pyruvate,water dikinase
MSKCIKWFSEIGIDDVPLVGGKNASLGEMFRELTPQGVRVPNGFATTAGAYFQFLNATGLDAKIRTILGGLDTRDIENLRQRGSEVRHAILAAELPAELAAEIVTAYGELGAKLPHPAHVAVRSSATAEDLPDASFAGQQETYLNVQGPYALLDACKRCFASLFKDRAISYRVDQGFDHFKIALSIGVQHMVRSDLASAGVIFTLDTETGFRDAVLINAAYGLGENVVQGSVNPDEYCVFKPTLKLGLCKPLLQKRVGNEGIQAHLRPRRRQNGEERAGPRGRPGPLCHRRTRTSSQLARWACVIEDHYSAKRGQPTPMDIEWAKDGETWRALHRAGAARDRAVAQARRCNRNL